MELKVIEGTWEEVARRGAEFAGRRVRVTVLDDVVAPGSSNGIQSEEADETAFDVLSRAGLIGALKAAPGTPSDLATNPAHMEGFGDE